MVMKVEPYGRLHARSNAPLPSPVGEGGGGGGGGKEEEEEEEEEEQRFHGTLEVVRMT